MLLLLRLKNHWCPVRSGRRLIIFLRKLLLRVVIALRAFEGI